MYADDLIIFGDATVVEVRQIKGILDHFGDFSGLVVNPQKSTIWFSGNCDPVSRQMIMTEFETKLAQEQERYLGILVTQTGGARDLLHKQLLEKVQDKLSGWKANLLSHAGRLTLVKAVLLSLPVYYMSVARIPIKTVKAVTAIIRKFLWGKLDKTRYMSLMGWDKVCLKKEDEGVGVRDIKLFNEALLLKLVWQLASEKDKLWIQIFKVKYYPRKGFWSNASASGYSPLGRAIQQLKVFFQEDLMWHVGDGTKIGAINQPWYDGWVPQVITSNAQRDSWVADLIHEETSQWDRELMGALAQIENTAPKPVDNPLIEDRLVWLSSTRGSYTTAEGYDKLCNQIAQDTWRASEFNIVVDHLSLSFPTALLHLMQGRTTEQVSIIASIAWYLWKARNEAIFANKKPTPDSVLAQVRNTDNRQWSEGVKERRNRSERQTKVVVPVGTEVFLVDASWEGSN